MIWVVLAVAYLVGVLALGHFIAAGGTDRDVRDD